MEKIEKIIHPYLYSKITRLKIYQRINTTLIFIESQFSSRKYRQFDKNARSLFALNYKII